jgi:AAA domain
MTTATKTETEERPKLGGIKVRGVTEVRRWIKTIIFGDPFAGKTWLAGSAAAVPEMSPVLVLDIEGGRETLGRKWPDCEVVPIEAKKDRSGREVKSAWEVFEDVAEDLTKYPKGGLPWKTIIVDNQSEGFLLALQEAIDESVVKAAARNRERSEDLAESKDYGVAHSKFRKVARKLRNLDAHVIFTSWAREETTDKGKRIQLLPQLSGKLTKEITGSFSECWFLWVVGGAVDDDDEDDGDVGTRKLLVRERKKIKAKSRTDEMPTVIDDPTMLMLYEYIIGPSKAGSGKRKTAKEESKTETESGKDNK